MTLPFHSPAVLHIYENTELSKIIRAAVFWRKFYTDGPHTDTINIFINKKSIKNHASQGEKSLCFAVLKKAEANIIQNQTNKEPVILLDDIFSKLDKPNTELITRLFLKTNQTIISHTEKIKSKQNTIIFLTRRIKFGVNYYRKNIK